mmetsp:Transcript_9611/g.34134  ORF Transcript_9611/g.34134 Transcript_9611/m.34134 type:complete len:257 (-) Transcript_9611:2562-3332(-)
MQTPSRRAPEGKASQSEPSCWRAMPQRVTTLVGMGTRREIQNSLPRRARPEDTSTCVFAGWPQPEQVPTAARGSSTANARRRQRTARRRRGCRRQRRRRRGIAGRAKTARGRPAMRRACARRAFRPTSVPLLEAWSHSEAGTSFSAAAATPKRNRRGAEERSLHPSLPACVPPSPHPETTTAAPNSVSSPRGHPGRSPSSDRLATEGGATATKARRAQRRRGAPRPATARLRPRAPSLARDRAEAARCGARPQTLC